MLRQTIWNTEILSKKKQQWEMCEWILEFDHITHKRSWHHKNSGSFNYPHPGEEERKRNYYHHGNFICLTNLLEYIKSMKKYAPPHFPHISFVAALMFCKGEEATHSKRYNFVLTNPFKEMSHLPVCLKRDTPNLLNTFTNLFRSKHYIHFQRDTLINPFTETFTNLFPERDIH